MHILAEWRTTNAKRSSRSNIVTPTKPVIHLVKPFDGMDEEDFEFVNSIPKPVLGSVLSPHEHLFDPHSRVPTLEEC